ncbi:hypothetical protein V8E36_009020 [Tilletia maclaganii]
MHASSLTSAAIIAFAASTLASNSHNAIRRPALPRRLDSAASGAVSDPVAERGILDALFGRYHGTGTWYGVGVSMGACGAWTSPDQRAVALNIGLYGNQNAQSSWCGKKLRITANGKTSIATVVDCCPTCPGGGDLDMSKTLFQDFAGLGEGVVDIKWSWVGADEGDDGGDDDDNSNHGNKGASTKHNNDDDDDDEEEDNPKKKPQPPKTTKTPKPTSTTTKTKTKHTSTSTSTSTKSKTSSTTKKDKKPKQTPAPENNLNNLNSVIAGFQNMAQAGSN